MTIPVKRRLIFATPVALAILLAGYAWLSQRPADAGKKPVKQLGTSAASAKHQHTSPIGHIVSSEELILKLTPMLKRLDQSALNLRIPDHHSKNLFATTVQLVDLQECEATAAEKESTVGPARNVSSNWITGSKPNAMSREMIQIWEPLLSSFAFFKHAKFSIVRGEVGDQNTFRTDVVFRGLGFSMNRNWLGLDAELTLDWIRTESEATSERRIG